MQLCLRTRRAFDRNIYARMNLLTVQKTYCSTGVSVNDERNPALYLPFLMLYSQSVILILGWRPGDAVF